MVNKKIKAPIGARPSKTPSHQGAEPLKKALKQPKAPRAPRAPRQPAQPKKAPSQNVYIYTGGGGNPQVYSNIPQQFIQPQIQNPFLTVNEPINQPINQPVEQKGKLIEYNSEGKAIRKSVLPNPVEISTQTEINDEDRLERFEKPKKEPKEPSIQVIPSEAVPEESLFSELFTTPQKPMVSELEGAKGKSQKTVGFLNWETFNPDYNMTEGELDFRFTDAERRYREQQRYLGQVKDTKAEPEGNLLLIPETEENIFEYVPIPEQQPIISRPNIPVIRREVEEEEVEEMPEFPVKKNEVIQEIEKKDQFSSEREIAPTAPIRPKKVKNEYYYTSEEEEEPRRSLKPPTSERPQPKPLPPRKTELGQPAEEQQQLQAVIERIAQKEKELDEPVSEGRIEDLGQRAEAVSPMQAEVKRNPVGKPKGGVIEEYIPQPNNDLEGEEEAVRMSIYDELTKGKNRDQLANEITAFTEKNPWAKTFRDERGNKIARTSETMRDEFGNPIKTSSGKGNRQRDFNVGEMKSILDKLVIEKIKRDR